MPLESTLNAAWVFLSLIAVGTAFAAAYLRSGALRSKRFQVLCVVLIVAALFPYISSTDDALRMQYLRGHEHQTNPTDNRNHDNLMRLYEAMDAPVVAEPVAIVMVLFLITLVSVSALQPMDRAVPQLSGRSPPSGK